MKERKKVQRWAIQCEFEHVGPTLFKNVVGVGWGLLPTFCGGWALGFLCTYLGFLLSSKEKISQRESNRQPLHSELGASPLLPGGLWSSRT
jgi:hypothetical protein